MEQQPLDVAVRLPKEIEVGKVISPPLVVKAITLANEWIQVRPTADSVRVTGTLVAAAEPIDAEQSSDSQTTTSYAVFQDLIATEGGKVSLEISRWSIDYTLSPAQGGKIGEVIVVFSQACSQIIGKCEPSQDESLPLRSLHRDGRLQQLTPQQVLSRWAKCHGDTIDN
ncbi:hypothetical protein JX265_013667 [Neoarthrinium moseri]|uniref:Uncharacterized protein n=1 Tax=Neoarthrinium moseri TaxID=1658444 RepID=A0A9P9W819_9PEZI|nr:hypothetical protein JX265_013667 [Neoarthrinium moseri]